VLQSKIYWIGKNYGEKVPGLITRLSRLLDCSSVSPWRLQAEGLWKQFLGHNI